MSTICVNCSDGCRDLSDRRRAMLLTEVLGVWLAYLLGAACHAQSESLPDLDTSAGSSGRLTATPTTASSGPQANATFGFSMAAGKLGTSTDNNDDLVVCAPSEDVTYTHSVGAAGAAYVFEDSDLHAPLSTPKRLIPTGLAAYGNSVNTNAQMGIRAVAIGNPRGDISPGTPHTNLILIGSWQHDAAYSSGSPTTSGGSIEMFNYTNDGNGFAQKSLFAPLNNSTTGFQVPTEVRHFGHGLALGDVTGDGIVDLVVGAPGTEPGAPGDQLGRFYVFKGHADVSGVGDFYAAPDWRWIGLNPVQPANIDESWGTSFASSVAVCHFTDTAAREILVGREDRVDPKATISNFTSNCSPTCPTNPTWTVQDEPKGGSAYVFRGTYIASLFSGSPYDPSTNPTGTLNRVDKAPFPDMSPSWGGLDPDYPEYQVLRNPFGDSPQNGVFERYAQWDDQFGWFVFNGGDLGSDADSSGAGSLDGVDDAVVYAESTDYIGNMCVCNPQISKVGALWVYFGVGATTHDMVHDDKYALHDHKAVVLLERPSNVGVPQKGARFGRAFARIDAWKASATAAAEPGILIGESSAVRGTPPVTDSGVVYLVRLPLPAPNSNPLTPVTISNAFGSTPMTEPSPLASQENDGVGHLFGSWITVLDYKNAVSTSGQQFIVSSREASVYVSPNLLTKAGRAFIYARP